MRIKRLGLHGRLRSGVARFAGNGFANRESALSGSLLVRQMDNRGRDQSDGRRRAENYPTVADAKERICRCLGNWNLLFKL